MNKMDSELVTIKCFDEDEVDDGTESFLKHLLKPYHSQYKIKIVQPHNIFLEFTIGDVNVELNLTNKLEDNVDVCLITEYTDFFHFSNEVKRKITYCRRRWPSAPIIIGGNSDFKYELNSLKTAELEGYKIMSRKMGDKLAIKVGAERYIEYSYRNGQVLKVLFDEIVYAGLGKLKDEREKREKANEKKLLQQRNVAKKHSKKVGSDVLIFVIAALAMLIFSNFVDVL